jgi:biopolymer transport protein ExbD
VSLPQSSETVERSADTSLSIMIDRDGHFFVDNNEVLNPSIDTLKEAIARIGGEDHERMVTLRADGQTPHQAVVTAMDALGQLGFLHLSIATTPNKENKGQ